MNLTMAICCPSVGGHEAALENWTSHAAHPLVIEVNDASTGIAAGFLQKLQAFYTRVGRSKRRRVDVLGYMHSDTIIHDAAWDERVLSQFDDPDVAVVAFGGSLAHGSPDIYRVPYDYRQLARSPFLSNLTDAETHGPRETGNRDVAVIDSFAMFVRRSFLDRIGGWPVDRLPPNHCSDYWLSLMCHRYSQRLRMCGVSCTHAGGGKSQFDYGAWCATTRWKTDENMHREGHRVIYEEFRDVFPVVVT